MASVDTSMAGRVQAAFTAATATQATTASYVDVTFDVEGREITELRLGHAVSLLIRAKAITQNGLIKVLAKPHRDYPDWTELVAETALTAGTDTEIYADVLRHEVVKVQIKEGVAGGSVTVGVCAK